MVQRELKRRSLLFSKVASLKSTQAEQESHRMELERIHDECDEHAYESELMAERAQSEKSDIRQSIINRAELAKQQKQHDEEIHMQHVLQQQEERILAQLDREAMEQAKDKAEHEERMKYIATSLKM